MATSCPITRDQFNAEAKPFLVEVQGQTLQVMPREFSTGSLGWQCGGKMSLLIDGKPVLCVANLLFTVIGSKGLSQ